MLDLNELRRVASQSGARDIRNVEIDVILTHLLQRFHEHGLMEHLVFKGGTMLRKMVFGSRGRLSTDLDFTSRTDISADDLLLLVMEALEQPYQGIAFRFERDKDIYQTEEGCAANPVCTHAANPKGEKIKIQISQRELPVLAPKLLPQLKLEYFDRLPFQPADLPCLILEEAVAEKIRAASQRSKIRDLHDLFEICNEDINPEMIRAMAVLKLWNSGGPGLDYHRFKQRIQNRDDYDLNDLANLLRRDQRPDLEGMISRVERRYGFLVHLTEIEQRLAADGARSNQADADALIAELRRKSASL